MILRGSVMGRRYRQTPGHVHAHEQNSPKSGLDLDVSNCVDPSSKSETSRNRDTVRKRTTGFEQHGDGGRLGGWRNQPGTGRPAGMEESTWDRAARAARAAEPGTGRPAARGDRAAGGGRDSDGTRDSQTLSVADTIGGESLGVIARRRESRASRARSRSEGGSVDPKPRPNHRRYLEVLQRMTPEERLLKAFELTEFSRKLFVTGLRERHPHASAKEFQKLLLERLDRCHNQNY